MKKYHIQVQDIHHQLVKALNKVNQLNKIKYYSIVNKQKKKLELV